MDPTITFERQQRSALVSETPGSRAMVFTLREAGLPTSTLVDRGKVISNLAGVVRAMRGLRGLVARAAEMALVPEGLPERADVCSSVHHGDLVSRIGVATVRAPDEQTFTVLLVSLQHRRAGAERCRTVVCAQERSAMVTRLGPTRNRAIDLMRGLFVISMTFEHLAPASVTTAILHAPVAFDGASGFIMMSGLVLGMVQRSRWRRSGESAVWRSLLRRAGELFALQSALLVIALLFGATGVREPWIPAAASYPDPGAAFFALISLNMNPTNVDVLSLYVVLLILLCGAVALIARGLWQVALLLSVTLYALALTLPSWTTLLSSPGEPAFFNWGAWQLLFIASFIGGWHWRECKLDLVLRSRLSVVAAVLVAVAVTGFAVLAAMSGSRAVGAWQWASAKGDAGPVRLVMAFAVFVVLYSAVSALYRRQLPFQGSFIERIGQKSLFCFVFLSVVTIVLGKQDSGTLFEESLLPYAAIGAMVAMIHLRDRGATAPVAFSNQCPRGATTSPGTQIAPTV